MWVRRTRKRTANSTARVARPRPPGWVWPEREVGLIVCSVGLAKLYVDGSDASVGCGGADAEIENRSVSGPHRSGTINVCTNSRGGADSTVKPLDQLIVLAGEVSGGICWSQWSQRDGVVGEFNRLRCLRIVLSHRTFHFLQSDCLTRPVEIRRGITAVRVGCGSGQGRHTLCTAGQKPRAPTFLIKEMDDRSRRSRQGSSAALSPLTAGYCVSCGAFSRQCSPQCASDHWGSPSPVPGTPQPRAAGVA
jgi:hypothetical protein